MTQTAIKISAATGKRHDRARYAESLRIIQATAKTQEEADEAAQKERDLKRRTAQYRKASDAQGAFELTRKDPLCSFLARHRAVATLLRVYHAGGIIGLSGSNSGVPDRIDCSYASNLEKVTDLRFRGRIAKQRALEAITPRKRWKEKRCDYKKAVWGCIVNEMSMARGVGVIGLADSTKNRDELKRAICQALDAAGDYLGISA